VPVPPPPSSTPAPEPSPSPFAPPKPPAPAATPVPVSAPIPVAPPIPVAAPIPVPPAPVPGEPAAHLQDAAVNALVDAKQGSASDAIGDATFQLEGDQLRILTTLSKTMLPVVINADADKVLRLAIRQAGGPANITLIVADPTKPTAAKSAKTPRSGSVQAKAMEHPIVQRAQSLFQAEIRNVIDLRED